VQTVVPLPATAFFNNKLLALAEAHGWTTADISSDISIYIEFLDELDRWYLYISTLSI
jgi:hypothetical protein